MHYRAGAENQVSHNLLLTQTQAGGHARVRVKDRGYEVRAASWPCADILYHHMDVSLQSAVADLI